MYAVAFGQRTGENHHTYSCRCLLQHGQVSFISNFGSSERYVVLIHLYRSKNLP